MSATIAEANKARIRAEGELAEARGYYRSLLETKDAEIARLTAKLHIERAASAFADGVIDAQMKDAADRADVAEAEAVKLKALLGETANVIPHDLDTTLGHRCLTCEINAALFPLSPATPDAGVNAP